MSASATNSSGLSGETRDPTRNRSTSPLDPPLREDGPSGEPDLDTLKSALLDALHEAVFLLDHRFVVLHANRAALESQGMTIEEIRSTPYPELSGPARNPASLSLLQRVQASGLEESIRLMDGEDVCRILATPATGQASQGPYMLAVLHRDESEQVRQARQLDSHRKELERRVLDRTRDIQKANEKLANEFAHHRLTAAALARSESRYRAVVESAREAILRLNGNGVVEFLNTVAANYVGASPESIIGKTLWQIFPKDAARKHLAAVRTVIRKRRCSITKVETVLHGRTVWFRTSLTPLEDPDTGRVSALLVVRDISTEERMAEALRESESAYRTLVDLSADGIYIAIRGVVEYANPSLSTLTGLDPGELPGRAYAGFYADEETPAVAAWHERILAEADAPVLNTFLRNVDGDRVPVELAGRAIQYRDRPALLVYVHDLSPRHELQERLVTADRLAAVGTLAAGIAHEFNNVNVTVRGFADLTLQHPQLPPEIRDHILRIRTASQRAQRITDSLGTFGGNRTAQRQPTSLKSLVETTLELLEHVFRKESCELLLALAPVPPLNIDKGEIGQVILNLLLNAVHAVLDRPERIISVETGIESTAAFVRIADTGHGIPREIRNRIFDAFFSTKGEFARDDTQARIRGSGLGLSISYRIVSDYGGRIEVESDPGVGSTFTIRLPLQPEASVAPANSTHAQGGRHGQELVEKERTEDLTPEPGC